MHRADLVKNMILMTRLAKNYRDMDKRYNRRTFQRDTDGKASSTIIYYHVIANHLQ